MTALEVIDLHIPSLTAEDETDIAFAVKVYPDDVADLAIRTCACGVRIDGFYEYVDHLKDELMKNEIANCEFCVSHKGQLAPPHFASERCESGRRNHCACNVCF